MSPSPPSPAAPFPAGCSQLLTIAPAHCPLSAPPGGCSRHCSARGDHQAAHTLASSLRTAAYRPLYISFLFCGLLLLFWITVLWPLKGCLLRHASLGDFVVVVQTSQIVLTKPKQYDILLYFYVLYFSMTGSSVVCLHPYHHKHVIRWAVNVTR